MHAEMRSRGQMGLGEMFYNIQNIDGGVPIMLHAIAIAIRIRDEGGVRVRRDRG